MQVDHSVSHSPLEVVDGDVEVAGGDLEEPVDIEDTKPVDIEDTRDPPVDVADPEVPVEVDEGGAGQAHGDLESAESAQPEQGDMEHLQQPEQGDMEPLE